MQRLVSAVIGILLLSATVLGANSPVSKGSWKIGGSAGFSSTGGDSYGSRVSVFSLMPSAGKFISDRLLVGAAFQFTTASSGGYSSTAWGLGPSIAYYFKTEHETKRIKGSLYPFVGGSFMIAGVSAGGESSTGVQFGFDGGIEYMVTRSTALDVVVSFAIGSAGGASNNVFGIGAGFSFFLWE